MGANGKGNGKKEGIAVVVVPDQDAGEGRNGKAKEAVLPKDEAPAAAAADVGASAESPPGTGTGAAAEKEPEAPSATASSKGVSSTPPPSAPSSSPSSRPAPASNGAAARTAAPAATPPADEVRGAAWGHPIARFEQRWTWLESRLLTFVLIWQILSLVAWVFLNGLSESVTTTAGAVFRFLLVAVALGLGAWRATRVQADERRRNLTLFAIAGAVVLIVVWQRSAQAGAGAALSLDRATSGYFDNVKGWLQEGSTLTLLGGLRGLGTRLTLWLALLGGSLATASGKHIHVDVVFRFIPRKLRLPVAIMNYLFAAVVCFAATWGFFDHIAIEAYGSRADDPAGVKIANSLHRMGDHAFFTRKQIGLDLRSMPHVFMGERYDRWMTASAWNAWVDGAGFEDRFDPAKVANLHIPDGTHPPFVVSPDGETMRSALAHTLGLVFPFGLLAIGLRFLLRALLTLSGHYAADPDEAHKEEIGQGNAGDEPAPEGGV